MKLIAVILLLIAVCCAVLVTGCLSTPGPGPNTTPPGTTPPGTTPPGTTPPGTTPTGTTPTGTYPQENLTACTIDSDCVPAQCCHPTSCINKQYKGVCTVLCTQICMGPVDCGAGRCGCVKGHCTVIPLTPKV